MIIKDGSQTIRNLSRFKLYTPINQKAISMALASIRIIITTVAKNSDSYKLKCIQGVQLQVWATNLTTKLVKPIIYKELKRRSKAFVTVLMSRMRVHYPWFGTFIGKFPAVVHAYRDHPVQGHREYVQETPR